MLYLIEGTQGPGFESPDEVVEVLEGGILPMFDALMQHETEGRIRAGGLPVGDRAFVFIAEADSNEELDDLLRNLPAWGVFEWDVMPLQSFAGRAAREREVLDEIRSAASG